MRRVRTDLSRGTMRFHARQTAERTRDVNWTMVPPAPQSGPTRMPILSASWTR
jgi:hypothetical protein